ncbi:glycosyltransferase family 4 protein [Providencia hangzhouensis]|nr:glycosyltransferase family 4 protein [Providencia rettgeri]
MKILFICSEYPPFPNGGIGTFTKELASELARNGHSVYVIGNYPIQKDTIEIIDNVTVYRKIKHKGLLGKILDRITMYLSLKKIILNEKIDIIETQEFGGPLAFYPKLNCKVITRLHGSVYYFKKLTNTLDFKGKIWKIIESSSIKKSDKIVSVSNFTAQYTKKIFNICKDIETIHNGICVPMKYLQKSSFLKTRSFVFAGSLIRKKGILELIDAWLLFEKYNNNVRLDIYGKDIENITILIKSKLAEHDCTSIVIHEPVSKEKLLDIYINSDFCIFPSKAEAFSLAPMEAMAISKVVLYSNQTSASELITNNFNGILIQGNNPEYILSSLQNAMNLSIEQYNHMALNAYNTINNNFNIREINLLNTELYIRTLKNEN